MNATRGWSRSTLALAVLAACSGSGTVAPSSSGAVNRVPENPQDDRTDTVARRAEIPESVDARERVLFTKAGSVWMMKPDGSDATQLTVRSHVASDVAPALSPRGDAIAWASARDGAARIYVMSLTDLLPAAITRGEGGGDGAPAWSPDGKQIAFVRGGGDRRDLYVVAADGVAPRLLLRGDDAQVDAVGAPAWSPDGRTIVWAADRRQGKGTLLWRVDPATGALEPLTPVRAGAWFVRDGDPCWSPDGKQVVFTSNRQATSADGAADTDLYMIGADGSGLTRLTDDPGRASDPAFSPDGHRLYFVSTRDRTNTYESELWVMAGTGGKQRRITHDERPQNAAPSVGRVAK
ncbi:MAG TPA: LpqB family beta-propeller domain-containing protein [Kofleriaceae bacterium]|nr:LpqB family beta-propeller domain-containing protein [Kofleriaceae bacterium]